MSGNYYSIDIWGLLIALVMVGVAAGISEAMRMGIGKTLLWSHAARCCNCAPWVSLWSSSSSRTIHGWCCCW